MVPVIAPLTEYLPGKAVPVSVEQGVPLRRRQRAQTVDIVRVVGKQRLVIEYRGGHEDGAAVLDPGRAVRLLDLHPLPHRLEGRRCGDEHVLHPGVSHAAGVGGGPGIYPGAGPIGPVPGVHQVVIDLVGELGQLVQADEVVRLALEIVLVLQVWYTSEDDDGAAGELPHMLGVVELRPGECLGIKPQGLSDEILQLWIGPADDQAPVIGDMHLTGGLHHQGVGLTAPRRPAVEGLVLRPGHKDGLFWLGPPDHITSHRIPHLPQTADPGAPRQATPPRRFPFRRLLRRALHPGGISSGPAGGWSAKTWRWWDPQAHHA